MSGCPCSTSTSSYPLSLLPSSSVPATPRCIRVGFSSSCGPRRSGMRRRGARDSRGEQQQQGREGGSGGEGGGRSGVQPVLVRAAAPSCRGAAASGRQCRPDALHDRGKERRTGMVREGNRFLWSDMGIEELEQTS